MMIQSNWNNMVINVAYCIVLIGFSGVLTVDEEEGFKMDECTKLLQEMRDCSNHIHLPKTCDGSTKSDIAKCADHSMARLSSCKTEVARKLIAQFALTFRNSDKILCQDNFIEELMKNKGCLGNAAYVALRMAFIANGMMSKRGCKYIKTLAYVITRMHEHLGCVPIVEKYIDAMYERSPCASVIVDAPTDKDIDELTNILQYLGQCWITHHDLPQCNTTEKSDRLKCVEGMNATLTKNPHLKTIAIRIVEVTEKTDIILCKNPKLLQDFKSDNSCWNYVKNIGLYIVRQGDGFYTEEGCRAGKYEERLILNNVNKNCLPLLLDYRKAMELVLPCVKSSPIKLPYTNPRKSVATSVTTMFLKLTIMFVTIHYLLNISDKYL